MPSRDYQQAACCDGFPPILNVGCKEDPSRIDDFEGVTHLDVQDRDPFTGTVYADKFKRFVQADARKMPFDDGEFLTVVLGELLEHCLQTATVDILNECHRVLAPGGLLVVTYPRDDRPPENQHDPEMLFEYSDGVTSYHQTFIEDADFERRILGKFHILDRTELQYKICPRKGRGWKLQKIA